MEEIPNFLAYLLSIMGLTVLIVWPQSGPSAWLRESVLRRVLPRRAREVLDCYICLSFWFGLALSPPFWFADHRLWCWSGCLAVPAIFWLVLRNPSE
jgi:hypothetical protein